MTLDEAIKHCEDVAAKCFVERLARNHSGRCGFEHLELAAWLRELKAYKEQEPCNSCCGGDQKEKAKLCQKSYLAGMEHRQELCEDAISRKAMLEYQQYLHGKMPNEENYKLWEFIKELPSVTPKQKTGKWNVLGYDDPSVRMYKCSECHMKITLKFNYCPNCGAKMEGGKK
jgi:hypothetical protein